MIFFFWSYKNENGRQNRSSGAKTGLQQRAGLKFSAWGTLATSGPAWSVIYSNLGYTNIHLGDIFYEDFVTENLHVLFQLFGYALEINSLKKKSQLANMAILF